MNIYSMHFLLRRTLFALVLLHFSTTPIVSTSRRLILNEPKQTKIGFRVDLKHVDHGSNYTKLERIQRGIDRGKPRLQRLNAMVLASDSDSNSGSGSRSFDVESTIHPGNGEFLMDIAIGEPPISFSAIMDTGSDLIWTQCKPCEQCFDQPTPIFDPSTSSTFSKLPCSNNLCQALPTSACDDGCQYMYTYGDYSSTQGILATETFTFGSGSGSGSNNVSVPNIGFGCGEDNEGKGFSQGSGLIGLGRGPLSLVSQLDEPKFSYCLTSVDGSKTSTLLMGSIVDTNTKLSSNISDIKASNNILTTPLVQNPSQASFYYLTLEGISVGSTNLPLSKETFALNDDGSGGMIIDSGTTITYLEDKIFSQVKKQFISQMDLPLDDSGAAGLDLCFKMPKDTTSLEVPKMIFHFKGADLDIPSENYLIGDTSMGILCLAMGSSSGMSIFGNVQQQNIMVVYDLAKESLSFIPTQCDAL